MLNQQLCQDGPHLLCDCISCACAATLQVPVALGEQEYRLYDDWRAMLNINYTDGRATDIAQPDLGYIGGINRALQVGCTVF